MRISRRRPKFVEEKKDFRFNERIVAREVFVIGDEGAGLGIMKTQDAINLAREQEMDLVEINPKAEPPVAKIMNFGHFKYQQEKQDRLRRAHQHVMKIKCVRLSLRIGAHDLEIRKDQAVDFLNGGDKAKIEIILKGRELQQGPMAFAVIKKFIEDVGKAMQIRVDQPAERQGNKITSIIVKS